MANKKTEYPLVNIARLAMALAVVALHFNPLTDIWPFGARIIGAWVSRIAVPFFFMVSGYFTAKSIVKDRSKSINASENKTVGIYETTSENALKNTLYNDFNDSKNTKKRLFEQSGGGAVFA